MYQMRSLRNGARLAIVPMPHTRSATVAFLIGTGSRYEDDHYAGASHFIEHMLFKGTQKRPTSRDIAVAIEGIGGIFNAGTGHESTNYWAKVAQSHLPIALDVLVDMLQGGSFCDIILNGEYPIDETLLVHAGPAAFQREMEVRSWKPFTLC